MQEQQFLIQNDSKSYIESMPNAGFACNLVEGKITVI